MGQKRLRKCRGSTRQMKEDFFSWLPDEVIESHILSRLTLQEAALTSVLSHRWRWLWTSCIGPKLIFSALREPYCRPYLLSGKLFRSGDVFARGISRILETYGKPTLDELTVRAGFDQNFSHAIDRWLECAFRKGVIRIELDFSPIGVNFYRKLKIYAFPSLEKLSAWGFVSYNNLQQPVCFAGLHNLRQVTLKYVTVSSEVIELMLSSCPLEQLCLRNSRLPEKLKVKSLKLKSLEVVRCYCTMLKVSALNLVSLTYDGLVNDLRLRNAPRLSELVIGEDYTKAFLRRKYQDFKFLSQLQKLALVMSGKVVSESITYAVEFPKLEKLEHLEVKMTASTDSFIFWPLVLIKAAPSLLKLSIELKTWHTKIDKKRPQRREHIKHLRNSIKSVLHPCLKVVELRGFVASNHQLEFGQRLVGIAESLEQFVVVPYGPSGVTGDTPIYSDFGVRCQIRKRAHETISWLPPGVKLVVL